ncbi:hypothetical protein N7510_009698 [Penicillium lagena]|uniref:uncharacterized protein n=1 Tax=Penicillium lagena TaxID=94218 RepID=UPI002540AE5B|nr:uncharacterized protein N7510_009698 [Penicillium lagena]KAJ5604544.1 hypothetical protein N7510_009698 [Penicillium lagena]
MTAAGVSPSSSPRLPSPPPFTEVQIGPQSPSVGDSFGKDADNLLGSSPGDDDGSTRRIRPGTKAGDMAFGPPLIPLSQLDSPFQLQEHLKALYHHFTKPEGSDTVVPITREVAIQLAEPPEGVDRSLWLYELCRFLTMKVNNLLIAFFAENPPCSSQTCPEMRASEWQYLCAVHDPPKSCCAIDYCCHTLDWATNTLTSPKYFPSRLTLGNEAAGGPQASMRHLTNIFRRLYRIFAHAWFQHRDVFWEVEGHDGLYVFFKTVCDMYNLIPDDNYTIPPEAEGPDAVQPAAAEESTMDNRRLTILRKDDETPVNLAVEDMDPSISTGATTRRHKHSPSTGSRVTTISESAEDQDDNQQKPSPVREASAEPSGLPKKENVNKSEETEKTPVEKTATESTDGSQEKTEEPAAETQEQPSQSEEPTNSEQPGPQKPETTPKTEPEEEPTPSVAENKEEAVSTDATAEPESAPGPKAEPETQPDTEAETKES